MNSSSLSQSYLFYFQRQTDSDMRSFFLKNNSLKPQNSSFQQRTLIRVLHAMIVFKNETNVSPVRFPVKRSHILRKNLEF